MDPDCYLSHPSIDELPANCRAAAFGVDYAHLRLPDGGDLYVTRDGWPVARCLLPANWYDDRYYVRAGVRLPGATGTVYHVPTRPINGHGIDIVVKFSRVGQEVPLEIATKFPDDVSPHDIANARFNSPWEEFALLSELRRVRGDPEESRVLLQRPLAIYAPPQQFELWKLGRSHSRFSAHQHRLARDQESERKAIEMDIRRDYVVLFNWIKGHDAEQAFTAGQLTRHDLHRLTRRVIEELRARGFRVLDNKPRHFIVRTDGNGHVLRRNGRIVYGLVDFELLERTDEARIVFKSTQRQRYFQALTTSEPPAEPTLRPGLKRVNIFNVDYVYGLAPNGGMIWAVGTQGDLFDFFLPDRWRRTPRIQLSLANEVYRTRTRDNIHIVYRRSRVGERPMTDPFYEQGRRLRDFGYNSPFEEIAVAQTLRQAGIPTIYPRAIYRTGHESVKARYLVDNRRCISHADLMTPDDPPQPILSEHHDYYTIWGFWRGIDPQKQHRTGGHWGFVDVTKALEDQLLNERDYHRVVQDTRRRLANLGFNEQMMEDYEFLLSFEADGHLLREPSGDLDVTLCMDALTAYDNGLLDEHRYKTAVTSTKQRLYDAGFEPLNLTGNHLLLAMNPSGVHKTRPNGELEVTLCNFEMIRMLYCTL